MEVRFSALADALTSDIDNSLSFCTSESRRFALLRLKERFRKKFVSGSKELSEKALDDFLVINESVAKVRPQIDSFVLNNARLFIELAFERYARTIDPDLIQVKFVRSRLLDNWRFGPGASNGIKATHTVDKMMSDMTVTPSAEQLVRQLRLQHTYLRIFDETEGDHIALVSGSKMSTVPKNEKTARTIAIEPSGNMALQLAVGRYLEDVLRVVGLDIRTQQTINRKLAASGSKTGRLATLDLKSASDMITPSLVKLLLPAEVYRFLMRIRSPSTTVRGKEVNLNMISTMGNGFTFPLMTMILLALCYAVLLKNGGPFNFVDYDFISVFGDDVIVPTHISEEVIDVIESAGLIVNKDKSFRSGYFRESCGGDFYIGEDVSPFYIKALSKEHDVYVAINQVLRFCGHHNVVFDKTLRLLRSFIDRPKLFLVPEWSGDTYGVRTTQVPRRYSHFAVKARKKVLRETLFIFCLAAGGYLEGSGPLPSYTVRPREPEYRVRRSRLPNGFLDGRCCESYSDRVSSFIESWLFLLE